MSHAVTPKDSAGLTPADLIVGGLYNWRNQSERLAYMGVGSYFGDGRKWHQFEKIDAPGDVWCEVLDADLKHFEKSRATVSTTEESSADQQSGGTQ